MLVHVLDFGADENKSQEIHSYESITHFNCRRLWHSKLRVEGLINLFECSCNFRYCSEHSRSSYK